MLFATCKTAGMRVLDLFSGAGGAAMGLHRAWPDAEIIGVDNRPQPRYPFVFVQGDAMTYPLEGFDFIWASPPCQHYSTLRKGLWKDREHPDLVEPIRKRLLASGAEFVIENVMGAPMRNAVMLCGTMFNLGARNAELRRHRLFETSRCLGLVPSCAHGVRGVKVPTIGKDGSERYWPATIEVYGNGGGSSRRDKRQMFPHADRAAAMGIDWMNGKELSQAIPPAYSEYIARQFTAQHT